MILRAQIFISTVFAQLGSTQSMRKTRYRAKSGPEVVLVALCAFFTLTVVRTTWFNTIYEKDTLSR